MGVKVSLSLCFLVWCDTCQDGRMKREDEENREKNSREMWPLKYP